MCRCLMLGAVCDTWVKVQSFILFDSSECLRASDERTGVCVKQRDVLKWVHRGPDL